MKEIRLCWPKGIHERGSGFWMPDNAANQDALAIVMEAGNHVAGEGTHWIEQRDA